MVQLRNSNLLAPSEEIIRCHYLYIFLVFKVLQDMDHVVSTESISHSKALVSEALHDHIEDLLSYIEHVLLGDLFIILLVFSV